MENLTNVLNMGGYATYVWPSFIVAAVVMSALVITSLRSLAKAQRALETFHKVDPVSPPS